LITEIFVQEEVWDLRINDAFCLDCDSKMEYYGYEKGSDLDQNNIINSEMYETDDYEPHIFLNFHCPRCKKKTSIMTH